MTEQKPSDFTVGQRVQFHPATDHFMKGLRYGEVTKIGTKAVWVRADRDPKHPYAMHPDNLLPVND